jgi:hypothetical protein
VFFRYGLGPPKNHNSRRQGPKPFKSNLTQNFRLETFLTNFDESKFMMNFITFLRNTVSCFPIVFRLCQVGEFYLKAIQNWLKIFFFFFQVSYLIWLKSFRINVLISNLCLKQSRCKNHVPVPILYLQTLG